VIHRYNSIKHMSAEEKKRVTPRVVIFAGKAAPNYEIAKLVIQLINNVSVVVNADKSVGDLLKVVFIANYCVSLAEIIIPAADISQHISTAGTEACGTSAMKFAMNGCLILGTMDGAILELAKEIGEANIFTFGTRSYDVANRRNEMRNGEIRMDSRFENVLTIIERGDFGATDFTKILNSLRHGNDYYLLSVDFNSYVEAQEEVDGTYKIPSLWYKKSIMSTAGSGKFSSDRSIKQYANQIWKIKPARRSGPVSISAERLATLGIINSNEFTTHNTSSNNVISLERMADNNEHAPPSHLRSSVPLG
jgi:glycogen phosphorylase